MQEIRLNYFYIDGKLIQYRVTYSSRINSKIYVTVAKNTTDYLFDVRAPFYTPNEKMETLILNNYEALMNIKEKKDNFSFINLKKHMFMFRGQYYPFNVFDDQEKNRTKMVDNTLFIYKRKDSDTQSVIESFLKKEAKKVIPKLVEQISDHYKIPYNEIKIKKLTKTWGSCRANSKILTFSYNLMHFENDIIVYVICHELAHMRFQNHSKDFWHLVSVLYPDFMNARKKLKNYII